MKQYGIALALIASVVMSPLSWATEQAKQQLQDKMQQLESVQEQGRVLLGKERLCLYPKNIEM